MNSQIPPHPPIEELEKMSKDIISYLIKHSPSRAVTRVMDKFNPDFRETKKLDPCFLHAMSMLQQGKMIKLDNKHKNATLAAFVLLDDNGQPLPHETIDNTYESPTFGNWITTPYEQVLHTMCYDHFEKGFPVPDCSECEKEIIGTICQSHNNPLRRCKECLAFTEILKMVIDEPHAKRWIHEAIKARKAKNLEDFQK